MDKPISTPGGPGTIPLRAYTVIGLARLYNIDKKTFRRWLIPFQDEIGERSGYYYNVRQVQIIIEKLGYPTMVSDE
jgi:hypothetical protein